MELRNIKFPLKMANGEESKTIEDLRQKNISSNYTYLNPGDRLTFGNYDGKEIEWEVIKKTDNTLMIISTHVLCDQKFDTGNYYWSISSLRRWLNDDFYNTSFSDEEKESISFENGDNIFLLSKEEAEILMTEEKRALDSWWWLRTPFPYYSSYAWLVDSDGGLEHVRDITRRGGVRPALNLKL